MTEAPKKKKIYVAGPMSGFPNFNFDAFHSMAEHFRLSGWTVFNPAEKDEEVVSNSKAFSTGDHIGVQEEGFNFRDAYLWDVSKVIESDAIFMLEGWESSPGARGEHAVAVAMQKHYPEFEIFYA